MKGTAFAAFIKLLLPLIVVIPGIAAFVIGAEIDKPDEAYPWVLNNYVTSGFKGIAFAALMAAIGSSLSSMVNSTSTIFTLDIYKQMKKDKASDEKHLVNVGKWTSAIALIIGVLVAPLLGNLDQAFQYIQEYTGFISPGIVAVFLLGIFWKKASANAALVAVILSIPLSAAFKFLLPSMPFMDRIGICLLILLAVMIVISLMQNKDADAKAFDLDKSIYKTDIGFNLASLAVCGIITVIYAMWW